MWTPGIFPVPVLVYTHKRTGKFPWICRLVDEQRFTSYGESKVNALGIKNNVTRATVYGESELEVNVKDEIKVTAYGEAKVNYKGNPVIKKGITIGGVKIKKID